MATAQLRHFTHPQHLLLRTQHHSKSDNSCDICGAGVAGLVGYRCDACDFDIHEDCTDDFKETISFFTHPWHTLTLTSIPTGTDGQWAVCALCTEECPQGSFAYRCVKCGFDVHPHCTTLPQTRRSPLDPSHDLNLVPAAGHCTACREELPVWHYRCGFCQVMLHIGCTSGVPRRGGNGGGGVVVHSNSTSSDQNTANVNVRPSRRSRIANFIVETTFTEVISQALVQSFLDLGNSGAEPDNLDAGAEPEI